MAGVERLDGLMVFFRGIDRKCVASTGSTEVEELVATALHDRRIRTCT